jgi:hypothetical protein
MNLVEFPEHGNFGCRSMFSDRTHFRKVSDLPPWRNQSRQYSCRTLTSNQCLLLHSGNWNIPEIFFSNILRVHSIFFVFSLQCSFACLQDSPLLFLFFLVRNAVEADAVVKGKELFWIQAAIQIKQHDDLIGYRICQHPLCAPASKRAPSCLV